MILGTFGGTLGSVAALMLLGSTVLPVSTAPAHVPADAAVSAAVEPPPSGGSVVAELAALDLDFGARLWTFPGPLVEPPGLPANSVSQMQLAFRAAGFDLAAMIAQAQPVPRLFFASFPRDITDVTDIDLRKRLFFKTMLPIVLEVNDAILRDRWRLRRMQQRLATGDRMTARDRDWLAALAVAYRVDVPVAEDGATARIADIDLETLLIRVDAIPPSMALAQAALESGWGTSGITLEGNALFGQITLSDTGLAPQQNRDGTLIRFAAFDSLLDSTAAYARNLNSHPAYAPFRALREEMRKAGAPLDGYRLMDGLLAYSELGSEYLETVRLVMRANDLPALDAARLDEAPRWFASAAPAPVPH